VETSIYLDSVERFAGRKFALRRDVGALVEASAARGRQAVLDELAFQAKFLTHAQKLLRQFGMQHEETARLSDEFSNGVKKAADLIRTLLAQEEEGVAQRFESDYLQMSQPALTNFLALMADLAMIKNYTLDRRTQQ
jgi:hypothetical protein